MCGSILSMTGAETTLELLFRMSTHLYHPCQGYYTTTTTQRLRFNFLILALYKFTYLLTYLDQGCHNVLTDNHRLLKLVVRLIT